MIWKDDNGNTCYGIKRGPECPAPLEVHLVTDATSIDEVVEIMKKPKEGKK